MGHTIYTAARDMVVSAQFGLPDPPAVPVIQRGPNGETQSSSSTGQEPSRPVSSHGQPAARRINILVGLDVEDETWNRPVGHSHRSVH